ncbi:glucosamine-6-phosphate deaminase [Alloscardovia criceti]|uniref:glucosamine-6-phosphate deaminase n=1 Tax=Alloscardovia criceti TaxID=356828 RepID=UPI00036C667C|nr:glucosamine-6-phosphate deaminase [Alloscardovia criceti]
MAEVLIVKTQEEAGEIYAQAVGEAIKANPQLVLGLATGSTPLAAYKALARKVKAEGIDVSRVQGFALDEYAGLDPAHPESYHSVIHREVVEPVGLNPQLIHVPNGAAETLPHAGADYDAAIEAAGGVDIQILGIGTDGHIGFNEPGSSLASPTRMKTLTQQTREDNARFFDNDLEQVPTHCITQGVGTIMKARHLVLLAFGEAKADAVAASIEGPVSAMCPASALQMHPHATFIVDEAAASKLKLADYYKWVAANKPEWQKL